MTYKYGLKLNHAVEMETTNLMKCFPTTQPTHQQLYFKPF